MSAQPLNGEISVYNSLRSIRAIRRHDSVGAIIKRLRPLIMSVVGREMATVEVLTRDSTKKDFSPYARDGQPIVMGLHGDLPFSSAMENIPTVDFATQIGSDYFIKSTAAGLTADLQGNERTVDTTYKVVGATT